MKEIDKEDYYTNREVSNQGYLKLGDINAPIVETNGRRKFRVPYRAEGLPKFQIKILEDGLCEGLLPMNFIKEGSSLMAYYNFDGLVQLEEALHRWNEMNRNLAQEVNQVLISINRCLLNSENSLLALGGFSLHQDTIFVDPKSSVVFLAYVPGLPHRNSIQSALIELIKTTEDLSADEQWKVYGKEIRDKIVSNNLGLTELTVFLGEIGREIFARQWPTQRIVQNIEKEEEPQMATDGKRRRVFSIFKDLD